MTREDIKKQLSPEKVNIGVVKSGTDVPFRVENNSPLDIEFHTKSCQCVANVTSRPRYVEGVIKADYADTGQTLRLVDGEYCSVNGNRYFNVTKQAFIENPTEIGEPVKARFYNQSLVLYFNDGNKQLEVNEHGEQVEGKQLKVTLPLLGWVLE